MLRSFIAIEKAAGELGPRQVSARISDASVDRAGDVLEPGGCDHANYDRNPIVLADHDPAAPIGTAKIVVSAAGVDALIEFAPAGASMKADEYCALAKAGVLNGVSVGFRPLESEPNKGSNGYRFTRWELLEVSIVTVPANQNALIVQRGWRSKAPNHEVDADTVAALHRALTQLAFHGDSARGHVEQVGKCLDWSGEQVTKALRHAYATGDAKLVDKLGKLEDARLKAADANDDLAEMVAELSRHVGKARDRADDLDGGAAKALRARAKAIVDMRAKMDATDANYRPEPAPPRAFMRQDRNRQLRVVITDEAAPGETVKIDELDFGPYWESRAVFRAHDTTRPIGWTVEVSREGTSLVATLQFPAAGVSRAADEAWRDVKTGKLRAASIGYTGTPEAGVIRELSLCAVGMNSRALVTEIAGEPIGAFSQSPAGGLLSSYGIENARKQASILYGARWGLLN